MDSIPDVLIVGAGAVGSALARALAIEGANVTLVERPALPGEAWRASAGMLAAQIEAAPGDPLFDLGTSGRTLLRHLAAELLDTTGIDIGLLECGILEAVFDVSALDRVKSVVASQRQQSYRADWLAADEVAHGWPWLAPCHGAFWSPDDAGVNPSRLIDALRADAERRGVRRAVDRIVALDTADGRVVGVIGESGRHAASTVVIAAGAWSGRIDNLPRPLSIEPLRGQMLAFEWPREVPPAIVYGDRCYLLKRDAELWLGATLEYAGFHPVTTLEGRAALVERGARTWPALADLAPLRSWAGLRPATPDGLPIMGPEPELKGLWYVTGHGRHGILLSAVTGELMARAIAGNNVAELLPFRPERFWS